MEMIPLWCIVWAMLPSACLVLDRIGGSMRPWQPFLYGFLFMQAGLVVVLPQLLARPEVMLGLVFERKLFTVLVVVALLCWGAVSLVLGACWGWLVVLLADQLTAWRGWPPQRTSLLVQAIQELRGLEVPEVAIEQIVRRQFFLPLSRVRAILETGRGQ